MTRVSGTSLRDDNLRGLADKQPIGKHPIKPPHDRPLDGPFQFDAPPFSKTGLTT
jgi:hypothetical protein